VHIHQDAVAGQPTRRRTVLAGLLAGAGVLATGSLSGCNPLGGGGPPPPPSALTGFLTGTSVLADRYDATLSVYGGLTATIGPIRDAHRAHASALAQLLGVAPPSPAAGPVPPDQLPVAIAALMQAERSAHDEAVAACLAASTRYVALLGSIAAARATHLEALR
jgi:hypothetical protein